MSNSDFLKSLHEMHAQQERIRRLNRLTEEFKAGNLKPEELYKQLFGSAPPSSQKAPPTHPRWSSVDEMMRDLKKQQLEQKQRPAAPSIPVDPETRKREINHELDIIRGRLPTPKGYTIDPLRAKALMAELKRLS